MVCLVSYKWIFNVLNFPSSSDLRGFLLDKIFKLFKELYDKIYIIDKIKFQI